MKMRNRFAWLAGAAVLASSPLWAAEPGSAPTDTTLGEKGVLFQSKGDQKSFRLQMQSLFQTSFTVNDAHGQGVTWDSDTANTTVDIARTEFSGHVVNPMYRYRLQLDWLRVGESSVSAGNAGFVNIGWVGYMMSDAFGVYMGQD